MLALLPALGAVKAWAEPAEVDPAVVQQRYQSLLATHKPFEEILIYLIREAARLEAEAEAFDRAGNKSAAGDRRKGEVLSRLLLQKVVQTPSGRLDHYHALGWVVVSAMLLTLAMMSNVNRLVHHPEPEPVVLAES